MRIKKISDHFGAEIQDECNFSDLEFCELRNLLYENKFLLFRQQTMSPAQFLKAAKRFGDPIFFIDQSYRHPDHPEIFVSSNVKREGRHLGMDRVGYYWHSDSSFLKHPQPLTFLHAQITPENGGETAFVDMESVLNSLGNDVLTTLKGRSAVHEGQWKYIIEQSDVGLSVDELLKRDREVCPPPVHPVVIKHPFIEKKFLYVNEGFTRRILGISYEESNRLLEHIFDVVINHPDRHVHKWQQGDLLVWDNRSVVHRAFPPEAGEQRMLFRIGINDGPFYEAG